MFDSRYQADGIIGRGGMGEVLAYRDRDLGRQVAVKISNDDGEVIRDRFIREARIQGQLEHPCIVPVYELGDLPDGRPYFVMKRVLGTPLHEILERLREGDPIALEKYSRAKLLGAFVSVCLAIDYAHSKNIVHRDLKPANIMLGDFGEVYVLDWGIAKLLCERTGTTFGGVLGTPGYMAPEQESGEIDAISIRTDVYALGAILFELLTLRPIRAKRERADGIPPELAPVVERALTRDISQRWAHAREMADAVDLYLDRDRALGLRAKAAQQHLDAAKRALMRARKPTSDEHAERTRALREAAMAMALSPSARKEATQTMVRVLLEPPRVLPSEVERDLDEYWISARRTASKISAHSAVVVALVLACGPLMGIRDWRILVLGYVVTALGGGMGIVGALGRPSGMLSRYLVLTCWLTLVLLLTRVFGPLILVPIVAANVMIPIVLNAYEGSRAVIAAASSLIPIVVALELLGVLAPSYAFIGGMMCILPQAVSFPETATIAALMIAQVGGLLVLSVQVVRSRQRHLAAEKRLRLHIWYLQRLVE